MVRVQVFGSNALWPRHSLLVREHPVDVFSLCQYSPPLARSDDFPHPVLGFALAPCHLRPSLHQLLQFVFCTTVILFSLALSLAGPEIPPLPPTHSSGSTQFIPWAGKALNIYDCYHSLFRRGYLLYGGYSEPLHLRLGRRFRYPSHPSRIPTEIQHPAAGPSIATYYEAVPRGPNH